ncbi:MAG: flippase-like domain-containing protein [Roseburia sp.]|nr:flippase-like domain-containing protein [Anaeroplasma bactoclasticum]MCM1196343.1 flippase-like domain-containing protein [Roseburia sp.]MCM1556480.1 flippase-like domain-containing protein [Anaeroplasma bactoclasticum]
MNQNIKKILPKLIFFIVLSIVVIIIVLSLNDMQEIAKTLKNVKIGWLAFGFLFLLLYMIFYPMPLCILGHSKEEENIKFKDSMMIGSIEYFFNGITPFSSGGQPFQIYSYRKIGVSLHRASGIVLMNFVCSQIALVLLCIGSLFFFNELSNGITYLQVMIIVGLAINILIFALFCSVGLSKTVRKLLTKFVGWLLNLKVFKGKLARFVAAFDEYCAGAQATFKALLGQKMKFISSVGLKLAGFICYYSIPFFILLALGIEISINKLALIIAMTTFSIAMTCYIPTPGATGGIEFAFKELFVSVVPAISASIATSGLLLWRFITYYFLMLLSFFGYLIFEKVTSNRQKQQQMDEEVLENQEIPLQNSENDV